MHRNSRAHGRGREAWLQPLESNFAVALDRDRRCRRAAWEFPRWNVPLGGTRMKWSKSRAVMVVGACLSNVWCGSPGMLRPARG